MEIKEAIKYFQNENENLKYVDSPLYIINKSIFNQININNLAIQALELLEKTL